MQTSSFVRLLLAFYAGTACGKTYDTPATPYVGPVTAEYESVIGNFDGQKIFPYPNATSYDWWYFDAFSEDPATKNESITIVFFETGVAGFPYSAIAGYLTVFVSGTFANGTIFNYVAPATEAVVHADTSGASGTWVGSGATFNGTSLHGDKQVYVVDLTAPQFGVTGTLTLQANSPATYPCSLNRRHKTEVIVPGVGWASAVPDAKATANFNVGGTVLSFTGTGYHDKNWGDVPFVTTFQSWYWGHARFGPFAIVWFDIRGYDGSENVSAYVTKNGKVLTVSCAKGAVKVRPTGANSEYPPVQNTGTPGGFDITYDLGKDGVLKAHFTTELLSVFTDEGTYKRILGSIEGGIVGGPTYTGRSQCEEFKFNTTVTA